eukprot:gene9202-11277_t
MIKFEIAECKTFKNYSPKDDIKFNVILPNNTTSTTNDLEIGSEGTDSSQEDKSKYVLLENICNSDTNDHPEDPLIIVDETEKFKYLEKLYEQGDPKVTKIVEKNLHTGLDVTEYKYNKSALIYIGVDGYLDIVDEEGSNCNICPNQYKTKCCPWFVGGCCELSYDGIDPSNYLLGPSGLTLLKLGAKYSYGLKYKYEIWRYFVPIILHGGVVHLFINLYSQLTFCVYVERAAIAVGASGAILAVLGAYMADLIFDSKNMDRKIKFNSLLGMVVTILLNIAMCFIPFVDWAAHLGGFIVGFLMACALLDRKASTKISIVKFISIGLLITYFTVTLTLFYTVPFYMLKYTF